MEERPKISDKFRGICYVPDSVDFRMFTTEEIKKLCVKKIVTSSTFDNLGHPIDGGLYDKALGPLNARSDPCGTCLQSFHTCPGHFGYIELTLPVLNPLFTKIISILLRISCLSCYHVQIPTHVKHSFITQMKLLNAGLLIEAIEIENKILELVTQYESLEKVPENIVLPMQHYESLAEETLNKQKGNCLNKNIESLRSQIISRLLKQIKQNKLCMHCRKPMDRVRTFKNKIIIVQSKKRADESAEMSSSLVGRVKENISMYLTPRKSQRYMRSIWENEKELVHSLIPVLNDTKCEFPTDILYFEVVPLPPPCARPVNFVNNKISENIQSAAYKEILNNCQILKIIIQVVKHEGQVEVLPVLARDMYNLALGDDPLEKLNNAWERLQASVSSLVDSAYTYNVKMRMRGLKQVIEKKAGLIRMHMMGKRVNYAARSVITPDPNLNIDEIGIPEIFAKTLTYSVPVTPWNVVELRKMVMNGPNVHPGATMVEFEDGMKYRLKPDDARQRESYAKQLLTPDYYPVFRGIKQVYRHLANGDVMLLNRQPTLHRPSIMAHKARVLKGEKTFRLHYANCKAYNADFDGDEMNAHFPQCERSRAEAYMLANVSNQYLVPKDGTPLSGLIQDHMIAGVRITIRGRFFNKIDYQNLVFQTMPFRVSPIVLLPPAIMKPYNLWSGKQIISTILINIIPKGSAPINLTSTSKISSKAWEKSKPREWLAGGSPFKNPNEMSEADVLIRKGELLTGVLDKNHYGATPYSLVHCMYELYGSDYATKLLSALSKLFTVFLQIEGFTLGVHDILVTEKADKKRRKIIEKSRRTGNDIITKALDLPEDTNSNEIAAKIEEDSATNPKLRSIIDRHYKSSMDSYTNKINTTCLPAGLICKFPENNLQLMVQSGAKGSTVNTMQISCLLGQVELEGKRPPIMISGKSHPSFPAFEFSPRAGGFIDGRFMTGIKPQEFFFHCMAGREGLIDTAVKTSRSGYLQRCLIKHLEGLKVDYDLTVRDSDNSVIQFLYGEDGMDISKAQFMNTKQLKFLIENSEEGNVDKETIEELKGINNYGKLLEHNNELQSWLATNKDPLNKKRASPFTLFTEMVKPNLQLSHPNKLNTKTGRTKVSRYLQELWREADEGIKKSLKLKCLRCPNPVVSDFQPDCYFGSLNERLGTLIESQQFRKKKLKKRFEDMLKLKGIQSLCAPGEPVGLLAAQSIGEPSTQMTLNTFHFAGRGDMNVTLGIPRLREILMMASKNIKTPSMEIPFLKVSKLKKKAENLTKLLTRVVMADVLEKIIVKTKLEVSPVWQQNYTLRFQFLPYKLYKSKYNVKPKFIINYVSQKFFAQMFLAIKKQMKINSNIIVVQEEKKTKATNKQKEDEEDEEDANGANEQTEDKLKDKESDDSSDDEVEDPDDAKQTNKLEQAKDDQEPEEEEKETSDEDEEAEDDEDEEQTVATPNNVVDSYNYAQNYVYDTTNHLWCEISFAFPVDYKKIDMTGLLKDLASKSVLYETPNIKRAITYLKDDTLTLRTDGINIGEIFKYNKLLDVHKLYCNDIHKVAEMYGIEAGRKVIVREVQDVFKVYGITVDPRHLLLIADYMTFDGTFKSLNRKGMESSTSPFQQMSFESSLAFLKVATIGGRHDNLQNPSSSVMLGKPCNTGTGCFNLLVNLMKFGKQEN